MAKTKAGEHCSEGTVSFHSHPTASYRYKVSATPTAVHFWLLDRDSMEEWKSEEHTLDDFVNAYNAIPRATMADYVLCFTKSLAAGANEDNDECRVDFTRQIDAGSSRLEFVVNLKLLTRRWTPSYRFSMAPVPSLAVDGDAFAQLQALRDEVKHLRMELATGVPLVLGLESRSEAAVTKTLVWTLKSESPPLAEGCFLVDPRGSIRFLRDGIYLIICNVAHRGGKRGDWTHCELRRDGQEVHNHFVDGRGSASFSCVVPMKRNQALSVFETSSQRVESVAGMWISLLSE